MPDNSMNAAPAAHSSPKLYNALILDNYIQLLRNHYPAVDIAAILNAAGIKEWEVSDPAQWFTQHQVDQFAQAVEKRCQRASDISIFREAGRFTASLKSKKVMRQTALSMVSPAQVYDFVAVMAAHYTKHAHWQVKKISNNCREITATIKKGLQPGWYQCENIIGSLEAITLMLWDKLPRIQHDECYFKGHDHCRYIISWDPPPAEIFRRIRNYQIIISLMSALICLFSGYGQLAMGIVVLSAIISLTLSLIGEHKEKLAIVKSYQGLDFKPDDYLISHSKFYNSSQLVGEISAHLARNTSTERVLQKLGDILIGLGFKRGTIFFVDYNANKICVKQAYAYGQNESGFEQQLAGIALGSQRNHISTPIIIDSVALFNKFLHKLEGYIKQKNYLRPIYIPITFERSLLGFFIIENSKELDSLTAGDIHLLTAVASQTALFITNISALDVVIRSEKMKNEFVAVASHEIRTPIQMIIVSLDELKYNIETHNTHGIKEWLDNLDESVARINIIVNKMMDFSRIEKQDGDLNITKESLEKLLVKIESEALFLEKKYNHEIEFKVEPLAREIVCDLNMMVQVMTNLITNSAKYTPEGGNIILDIYNTKAGLEICIIDNGVGIPADEQDKVFTNFYQIENSSHAKAHGLGLGLSFCWKIVKHHGGYISIASPLMPSQYPQLALDDKRKGCKFTIHLPPQAVDYSGAGG